MSFSASPFLVRSRHSVFMRFACSGSIQQLCNSDRASAILTPSPLLARVASQDFAQNRIEQGRESWTRAAISTVEAWLVERWRDGRYTAARPEALLSPSQEHLLWRNTIEQRHGKLFDLNATARLASRAASSLTEWGIPADGPAWADHPDALQFSHWRGQFENVCRREGWLTRSDLRNAANPEGSLPERVVFAGFNTLTPALRDLKRRLGVRAVDASADARKLTPAAGHQCETFGAEIEHAARWARIRFEQNPSSSIAIFVPQLATNRAAVERTFRNIFYPPSAWLPKRIDDIPFKTEKSSSVFHLFASAPLSDHPVVSAALLLCQLEAPLIAQSDAGAILRSPFLAGAEQERSSRAFADLRLRKERELDVSRADIGRVTQSCPVFLSILSAAERVVSRKGSDLAELPYWSSFISDLLRAVRWPGESTLSPSEVDAIEGWKNALSQLASLGLISSSVSYEAALSHLRRLLARRGPATGDLLSPVQILDSSDASGLTFDSAFITGLSDQTWPPPMEVSPLIPLELQRAHGVPGASPNSIAAERHRLTRALFESARTVVASYTGRPSPWATPYLSEGKRVQQWRGKLPWQAYVPASVDEVEDSWAPPYRIPHEQSAFGGTRLIKSQSLCPFRAFAEFRLRSEAPEDACFGFDALERGSFVHDALKLIWEQLQSQERLVRMPADDLARLVEDSVASVVEVDGVTPIHRQSAAVERERLHTVILQWLALEKARKVPFVVEAVEEARLFDLAGLPLRLRVDRIDRLPDGSSVLVDYKSGAPNAKDLKGERPSEPQLLVYAASLDNTVDGVFFGQLKPREPRLIGFSRVAHVDKQKPEKDWDEFIGDSISKVEGFAREFTEGYAPVSPAKGACNYCRQKPFCRIQEKGAADEGEDSE